MKKRLRSKLTATLTVIKGPRGSGKTTLGESLQLSLPNCVLLDDNHGAYLPPGPPTQSTKLTGRKAFRYLMRKFTHVIWISEQGYVEPYGRKPRTIIDIQVDIFK